MLAGSSSSSPSASNSTAAPSDATPWYKNSCIKSALSAGALNVGIDAIGLIPEGGGATTVARDIGNYFGYCGIVADNFGAKAIQQIKGGGGTFSLSQGVAGQDWLSAGLSVAGFVPGLGQLAAGASIVNDAIKTGMTISKCH